MATTIKKSQLRGAGLGPVNPILNAKLTYSGSILSLAKVDPLKPIYLYFPDGTEKELATAPSFEDATGTSDIVGMEFGKTSGRNWADVMPTYFYSTKDASGNAYIFHSNDPTKHTTPATSTHIGYKGIPSSNNKDTDIFVWTSTNVTTTLQSRPCTLLGSFRVTKDTSDDWTVSALGNNDGIYKFNEETTFIFPSGQMGAASGKYFLDNSGTAPSFTTNVLEYTIAITGECHYKFLLATNSVAGAGAVSARLATPYVVAEGTNFNHSVSLIGIGTGASVLALNLLSAAASNMRFNHYPDNGGSMSINPVVLLNSSLAYSQKVVSGSVVFRVF